MEPQKRIKTPKVPTFKFDALTNLLLIIITDNVRLHHVVTNKTAAANFS